MISCQFEHPERCDLRQSLADKVRAFAALKDGSLPPDQLRLLLESIAQNDHLHLDLESHLAPPESPSERFTEVLCEDDIASVYLLCWDEDLPGTLIHDHGGSSVGIYVLAGGVEELVYRDGHYSEWNHLQAGDLFCYQGDYIHRVYDRPGTGRSVSIHVYSPPLTSMKFYTFNAAEQRLRPTGQEWSKQSPHESMIASASSGA